VAAGTLESAFPQLPQKRLDAGLVAPQRGQQLEQRFQELSVKGSSALLARPAQDRRRS
jgi:hypothetical protein